MDKTELYTLIAVFLLLTVALVWFGAKTLLDMHRRRTARRSPRHGRRQEI